MDGRKVICIFLTALFALPILAYSQSKVTKPPVLADKAFTERVRPASLFDHDRHTDFASCQDCTICHHKYENGRLIPNETSEGTPCSECHKVQPKSGRRLLKAYHNKCQGCHETEKKGPVGCGECHVKTSR
ncbi:MAG: cytochrome c3 family protein [Deltaproteobacteria bacterium]|nr:cytochrome c3 family protein [Deltaproteobacteria bacterium]